MLKFPRQPEEITMKLYGLLDLQTLTGIPQRTWRLYMSQGRLRYSRLGRRLMVTEEDLRAFVNANRAPAVQPEAASPQG
jgi:hypothetical protein